MSRIFICDTETTGLRKATPPASGVVQVAYIELDASLTVVDEFETLVNPGMPIEPGASNVHGIFDEMVETKKPLEECFHIEGPMIFIAHNKRFDWPRLSSRIDNCVGSLCTLEAAKRFLKGQPNNKLTTLVEHFGLEAHKAHDALGDVRMTLSLLRFILASTGLSFKDLMSQMENNKTPTEMPFGAHRGRPFSELPSSYLVWLSELEDLDAGLRRAVEMQRRIRGN